MNRAKLDLHELSLELFKLERFYDVTPLVQAETKLKRVVENSPYYMPM